MSWWYLDKFLYDVGLAASRAEARRAIQAGSVEINGTQVPPTTVYLVEDGCLN